jgi:hypothetical protein
MKLYMDITMRDVSGAVIFESHNSKSEGGDEPHVNAELKNI